LTANNGNNEYVGYAATGAFNQSGGTNNVGGSLLLANGAGTSGTYTLSGTGVLSAGFEYIGNSGTALFNHMAGSNTTSALTIGFSANPSSTYNLSGTGILSVNGDEVIGLLGTSNLLNQTGGAHGVSGELDLGLNSGAIWHLYD